MQGRSVALHQGAVSNFWRHTRQYRGMILVAIAAVLALLVILTLSRGRILG